MDRLDKQQIIVHQEVLLDCASRNHVKCTANATLNGHALASYKRDRCNLDGANYIITQQQSRLIVPIQDDII